LYKGKQRRATKGNNKASRGAARTDPKPGCVCSDQRITVCKVQGSSCGSSTDATLPGPPRSPGCWPWHLSNAVVTDKAEDVRISKYKSMAPWSLPGQPRSPGCPPWHL
jgi:hypothetical protein